MARTFAVAVIVDAARPYDRKIISGIAGYVKEVGNWSLYVEEDPLQKLPDLRRWGGQGIIANFDDRKVAAAVRGLRIPVVGVGGGYGWYDPAMRTPYFESNNETVARLAADHLLDHGFRRLAYYGYPRTPINGWSQDRAVAFRQRAREAGCPSSIYTGRHQTARKWAELQGGLVEWLRSLKTPVGLMACNDARARHVLEACRTLGAKVPDDVAVIGVDNDEMICELTDPPLSSIEQGARRMGYQAAASLDRLMHDRRVTPLRFVVEPEGVVARRSTDTLAIDDAEVAMAMRFIRDHGGGGIHVDDVVEATGLSRSSMERRFKAAMRRTIHSEIDRVQFELARQLVADTELPLKQVAARAGFKYIQYMTTLFRRRLGQTPREYRAQCRGPFRP